MIYADNWGDIKGGNNSYWNVFIERNGKYEFTLSRYPLEADTAMDAPLRVGNRKVRALPVTSARMKINDFDGAASVASGTRTVSIKAKLKAGKTRLETWLYDKDGNELCGAYYVRVQRLS
jgi:arylsulfatase